MAQVNKISSFKSFTEIKNQEATMKLRETNNAKRQKTVGKIGAILDEMGLTSLSELDEEKKQALIKKMFGNVSEDEAEDIEDELNKLGEPKKLEEGNAFIFAASKAKQDGKTEFEFNGKKYKVTIKKDTGLNEEIDLNNETEESMKTLGTVINDLKKRTKDSAWQRELSAIESAYEKLEDRISIAIKKLGVIPEGLVVSEAFFRMSKDVISDDLYLATKNLQNFYDRTAAGNDVDTGVIDTIIKALERAKKSTKKFNSKEEVAGTVYENESTLYEALVDLYKYVKEASAKTFKGGGNGQNLLDSALELASHIDTYQKGINSNGPGEDGFYGPTVTSLFKRLVDAMSADDIKNNNISKNESEVNEAEKFKSTKDFLDFCEEIDGMPEQRIKRIMGKDYIDTPGGYRDEAEDYDNDIEEYMISNMGKSDFEALRTWWENNVQESVVNEGDMTKSTDGFIVLDSKTKKTYKFKYVKGTSNVKVENEAIDKLVKATGESQANFAVHGFVKKGEWNTDKTPVLESVVTESSHIEVGTFVRYKKDKDFTGGKVKSIKGGNAEIHNWDGSTSELPLKDLEYVKSWNEAEVNEAEVSSDEEFKEYAITVLKKAFGDDFDEAKAGEVVDGILKKCDGDYGAAVGMLTSSLGESVRESLNEALKDITINDS